MKLVSAWLAIPFWQRVLAGFLHGGPLVAVLQPDQAGDRAAQNQRHLDRAVELAHGWNGQAVPWDQLPQALAQADELVLTEIDADFDGDTCFPEWRGAEAGFVEVARQAGTPQPGGPAFDFVSWRRTAPLPHPAA